MMEITVRLIKNLLLEMTLLRNETNLILAQVHHIGARNITRASGNTSHPLT